MHPQKIVSRAIVSYSSLRSLAARFSLGLCLAGTLGAQVAPAPSPAKPQEQPIELSPFVVDESNDVGYLANNTLAGSRLNTRLKDTPASISVFTPEFLEDLSAFRLEEAMQYAVNTEFWDDDDRSALTGNGVFSSYQDYRVRGLNTSRARNYFPTSEIPTESGLIGRIEDSRGPNAVVFGIGSPGGIINVSTKQALFGRDFRRVSLTVGSFDEYRTALDWNQPLIKGKLAARLNLIYNDSQSFRHWEFEEHVRAHIALGYRITDRTTLRLEFERGRVNSNRAVSFNLLDMGAVAFVEAGRPTFTSRNAGMQLDFIEASPNRPFVIYYANNGTVYNEGRNNFSSMITAGGENAIQDRSLVDFSVNHGGPAQNRESYFSVLTAFFEHQLTDNTFMEIGFDHREHKFDFRDPRGARREFFGDANALRADGTPNPFAGRLYLQAQWLRGYRFNDGNTGRAIISHDLDFGKWGEFRLGGYGEYDKSFLNIGSFEEMWVDAATGLPPFHPNPNDARNDVHRRTYVTEGDWASYSVSGPIGDGGLLENVHDPITGQTLNSVWMQSGGPREVYTTLKSAMVVVQGRWFNDRLIAAGGLRRDEFAEKTVGRSRDPVTQIWQLERDPALAEADAGQNSAIGRTKTFGLVYHVTPKISLYYNLADNVSVPSAGALMLHLSGDPALGAVPVPKPVGKGVDYGIGFSLLDDRLYVRGTWYTTEGKDQSVTSPSRVRGANERIMDTLFEAGLITQAVRDARTNVGADGLFGHKTTGVELQVTGNVTPNWRITAGYSYSDPVENYRFSEWIAWEEINRQFLASLGPGVMNLVTEAGRTIGAELEDEIRDAMEENTAAVGVGKFGSRHHKVSLFTRYNFTSEKLKGLYVGGGYRHQSKMFVGTDLDGNSLYGRSYWSMDAMAGYTLRNLGFFPDIKLQLNVRNVFDDREPLVLRYMTDNRSVLRERIMAPRTWRLSASFEF